MMNSVIEGIITIVAMLCALWGMYMVMKEEWWDR